MADDKIEIEIALKRATDSVKALKDIEKAGKESAKNTESAFKKLGNNFNSITDKIKDKWLSLTARMATSIGTVLKAFNFTKKYAEFKQSTDAAEQQFGVNAKKMIASLNAVADGTVNSAQLILQANKAMALGVTKDVDEIAELLEFARLRAQAMGIDTTFAFDSIVTGIGRGSPLILDNLGLITKGWNKEADAAGVAYDAQFILNKVLEQGREEIAKVGGVALTSAERFQQFAAGAENAKLKIGEALLPAFEKILPVISNVIDAISDLPNWLKVTGVAAAAIIPAMSALATVFGPIGVAVAGLATIAGIMFGRFKEDSTKAAKEATKDWDRLNKKFGEYASGLAKTQKKLLDFSKLNNKELSRAFEKLTEDLYVAKLKGDKDQIKLYEAQLQAVKVEGAKRALAEEQAEAERNKTQKQKAEERIAQEQKEFTERQRFLIASGQERLAAVEAIENEYIEITKGRSEEEIALLEAEKQKRIDIVNEKVTTNNELIESDNLVKENLSGLADAFRAIGGPDGALAGAILKQGEMIEESKDLEIQLETLEEGTEKAAVAADKLANSWNQVAGVIQIVKTALSFLENGMTGLADIIANKYGEDNKFVIFLRDTAKIVDGLQDGLFGVIKAFQELRNEIDTDEGAGRRGLLQEGSEDGISSAEGTQAAKTKAQDIGGVTTGALVGGIPGALIGLLGAGIRRRRAGGGPITSGHPYIVGERGPEIVVPNRGGTVIPNNEINNNSAINISGPVTVQANNPEEFFEQLQSYKSRYGAV